MSSRAPLTVMRLPGPAGAGVLLGILAGVTSCAPDDAPPTAGPEVLREGVDMVIVGMDHYLTRVGVRRARLLADTAEYVSENEIHLHPLELLFFDDDGREVSVLTADYGVFDEVSENMEATGNVVVLDRQDDRKLDTEHIRYIKEDDRLYGDSAFVMESNSGRTTTEGDRFEADPGLDNVVIDRPSGSSEPRVDTLTAEPLDSVTTQTPGDSLAVEVPDSLSVPDSTAIDSATVSRDTVARDTASRDTTEIVPDSTARDTTEIVPDSAARDTTARDSTASARRRERTGPGSG